MSLLEVKNLFFEFKEDECTLKNISVKIEQGEKIAVIGSNGAGKTTFFLCLNGVLSPHKGSFFIDGKMVKGKSGTKALREITGIVFQETESQLIAPTVFSEVAFGPMNMKLSKNEVVLRTESALKEMNLTAFSNRTPYTLSGGEKRRVAIADILAMDSKVIIMDEPTSGLDIENTMAFEKALDRLHNKGKTVIISTHDMDFALNWADRVWVFYNGEIIADGDAKSILKNEELLFKARLKLPIVYEIGKKLGFEDMPKSIDQLTDKIKEKIN